MLSPSSGDDEIERAPSEDESNNMSLSSPSIKYQRIHRIDLEESSQNTPTINKEMNQISPTV